MKLKAHAAAAAYGPRQTHAQHKAATHTNHTHIWSTDRGHDRFRSFLLLLFYLIYTSDLIYLSLT